MRKQSPVRLLFIAILLFLSLPQTFVKVNARAADTAYGDIKIENRDDTDATFSCDVKLSGKRIEGKVFAVLFSESEQMKFLADYPANETVRVSLKGVSKTDYIKILWTDENHMPLANPAILRMGENNAAAYENFTKQLAASLRPYEGASASSDTENPYALARLLVSCDALPDLSDYKGKMTTVSGPDNLHILQFYDPAEASKCQSYLEANSSVRYVEPDAIMLANAAELGTSSSPHSWGVSKTGIGEYAENLRQRGNTLSMIVAVVDSGVESSHPFLKNRLLPGYDFVQYDDIPQDEHGHGTHVTGTIVDCTPDMDVKIMPVRVLNAYATGSYLSIANGIRYAANHGANIINLSLGATNHSQTIDEAVRYAISKNITVVVAAGNKNGNVQYFCPAHMDDCITVAAVDSDLKRFELSNYGDAVDIAAPGVKIESSALNGKYDEMNGTSMATPHVSAAAALLMSERGTGQTPFQISSLLRDAATDVGEPGKDAYFGAGFLNMRPFIAHSAYAMLYADGELVFQKNNTPAPDRELVKSYPVATSGETDGQYAAWYGRRADIRKVTFADSIKPISTALWFYGCANLTEIKGLENLDVSELTDISQMFSRCASLKTLDLSAWDTKNAVNMRQMFFGCSSLATIYASDTFNVSKVTESADMFMDCTSLMGGAGTKCDSVHTDKEYAQIDGGASAPGYFTDKNPLPSNDIYAVLYADGELVFQNNNSTEFGRSIIDVYKVAGSYSWNNRAPWNGQRKNLTTVTFADKIQPTSTTYWFYYCEKLTEIRNIKNLNTANIIDMNHMFSGCSKLTALDVSYFDTANVANMSGMFENCSGLTALDVSRFDTTKVTDMGGMFRGCSGLTALDVSYFDTANVANMSGMFENCSGLTALDVSRFDTTKVTDMYEMFYGCSGLTALDVSRFNTANVTNMGWMFRECSGLTALDISHFDTAKVTDMSCMFENCSGLTALDISHFDTAKVTDMSCMFYGCNRLAALDVSHFDTAKVMDMDRMFVECNRLTELNMSHFDTANVMDMGFMFCGCSGLTVLDISHFNTAKVTDMERMCDCCYNLKTIYASEKFTTAFVPETEYHNSQNMFRNCASLVGGSGTQYDGNHIDKAYARIDSSTSAPGYFTDKNSPTPSTDVYAILYSDGTLTFQQGDVPESGKTIAKTYKVDLSTVYTWDSDKMIATTPWYNERESVRVVNFADKISPSATAWWFDGCENLEHVDNIQNLGTSNVTDMSCMFRYCSGLTALDISHFDTANVTHMYGVFFGCSKLRELDVSRFDTAKVTHMNYMFDSCSGLTELDVANFNTTNVAYMYDMFYGCSGLTALDLSRFDTANVKNMGCMFYGCSRLTTLDLSHFDTAKVTFMSEMFFGCSNLKTIYTSDKFTTTSVPETDVENSSNMFKNCVKLIGGDGTKYDETHVDATYARIDTASAPGYFTDKNAQSGDIYAVLYGDGELVFQNNNRTESGRSITDVYKVEGNYSWTTPWYEKNVKTVTFADKIQPSSTAAWFSYCYNLTDVRRIENLDTSKVTDMRRMFADCSSLTELDLSGFDTSNVEYMGGEHEDAYSHYVRGMFSNCRNLKTLNTSGWDTRKVKNMTKMFDGCNSLENLDISGWDTRNVTEMCGMFDSCSILTELDLSGFDTSNVLYMDKMFFACIALKTIYVGDSFVTESVSASNNMFFNCATLVGGAGTKWGSHYDKEYARIDGGASAPGYFTRK